MLKVLHSMTYLLLLLFLPSSPIFTRDFTFHRDECGPPSDLPGRQEVSGGVGWGETQWRGNGAAPP